MGYIFFLKACSIILYNDFVKRGLSIALISILPPLTSLNILNASLCNEELTEEERYELIRKQAMLLSKMEWLIATLLKISKLDAGTITLKLQEVYLKDVVEKAIRPLEIAAELKMQTIKKEVPAELKLTLDVEWTAEALGNVIKNCIEHSPEGGSIEIKAIERPLLTQVIIEDNGAGFQEKDIPHLFDRFYQGNGSTIGNAGLGLALAKTIINNRSGIQFGYFQKCGYQPLHS